MAENPPGGRTVSAHNDGTDLYRLLFRCSSDGLILVDSVTGEIQSANAAAGLMAGRPPDSMPGMNLMDLAEPQESSQVRAALEATVEEGSSQIDILLASPAAIAPRPVSAHFESLAQGRVVVVLHDVTEKARMLGMVRREREISRGLLESVNACVLAVDLRGRTTLLNRRFRETTGLKTSDVLSKNAVEMLVAERDRPAAQRAFDAVSAGRVVEELDLTIRSGDGERVLSFNGALLHDAEGSPTGMVWVAIDVTGTRRLMEEVRRGEERTQRSLHQLKEFSRVSGLILQEPDLDRVCTMFVEAIREVSSFNRAILTLCDDEFRGYEWFFAGLSEKEIAIFHQNKLTSREKVTIFQERFRLGNSYYIPHDQKFMYEGVRSRKESEKMVDWHPDDFVFIPLFGTNRRIVGIVSVDDPADGRRPTAESISPLELFAHQVAHAIEEKKLAHEVKKTTERYRTLVETMNEGLFTVDRGETITFVNAALLSLTGHQEDGLRGQSITALLEPDSLGEFRQRTRLRDGGGSARFELSLLSHGGDHIPVLLSVTPYREQNTLRGAVAIVTDLREQKKGEEDRRLMHDEVLAANVKLRDSMTRLQTAQEQLIQAEKLSALGELVSGVAHELNNPLTGVMGYAQLLMAQDVHPDFRKNLERINKEAIRCQRIVQNLLAFARAHRPERKLADINEVIADTLDLRSYQLKVDNVEVALDLASELPCVMADAYQLQQVFLNIVNNAHQAMMESEQSCLLTIRTRSAEGRVLVEFIDNGPGIPEEKIGRIFDPFFTTKEIGSGTGLGLSLSYGIVKEHDGEIRVISQPGHGATFIVDLPASREKARVTKSIENTPVVKKEAVVNGSILIVDDEETILELLMALLEDSGHVVETACNGRQALEKIRHTDFDVIISDLKMPDMGGERLYEEIGGIKPYLQKRMVFSTGDVVNPGTQSFFQKTGRPYIAKPFRLDDIEDLVGQVLLGKGQN